jgi:enterochelin esterase-like enzyme
VSPQYLAAQTNLSSEARADADLYTHAEQALRRPERPVVSVDCATEDPHLSLVRAFHEHLDAIGYAHEYREPPGGHDSAYWDGQIQSGLRQHMSILQREEVNNDVI